MPHVVDAWATVSIRVENAQEAMIGETLDGVIVRWNTAAAILLGYSMEEVVGRPGDRLLLTAPHPEEMKRLTRCLQAGEPVPSFETAMLCKDRRVITVSVTASPVFDAAEQLIGLVRIIHVPHGSATLTALHRCKAARRQLEREVAHLARWSAMGQMAMVLAHELNQPLTAIISYLTSGRHILRASETSDLSVLADAMDRANDQARRAAAIISRLRSFVSRDESERRPVSIAATIIEASELALIEAKRAGVMVDFQLTDDAVVSAERVQIQQVIFNLMRNAIEAMAKTPLRELRISTARDDQHIVVSISDSGPGISPEIAARLFQPFVTDKSDGMGVGLSICHAVIAAHGGDLWFDDAFSTGATFHFKLPLAVIN